MKRIALAVSLLLLALAPLLIDNSYYLNIATQVLISAIFAQGLNLLVGYAGLVSLGHAGLFGVGAYTAAFLLASGSGQVAAAALAIGVTLATSAVFAFLALRATGIGFFMITVALGQIAWGIAYRWISLTGGDNGISIAARPAPFGISLAGATPFFYATLIVFLAVQGAVAVFTRSPLGVSLRGTRDQPRRMTALGFNVWLIRFIAFVLSGLVSGIAGLLSLYQTKFVSPHVLSLGASAEALLMVISGGTATLLGPVVGAAIVVAMKYIVSAYVERWNLVLGAIFVAIVLFMPEGLVPGSVRLWRKLRSAGTKREAVS
ncbi:MAG: branched-chain amino acid transporter permease [Rhodospirillales bacterium]|nr:branched-chain amino acid transporter permease [Rhodospirillales bacterium]